MIYVFDEMRVCCKKINAPILNIININNYQFHAF